MPFAKALFFCFKAAYKSELLLLNGLAAVSPEGNPGGLQVNELQFIIKGITCGDPGGESRAKQNPNAFCKGIVFLFPKNAQK
jgi:hypothetical protein